MVVAKCKAPVVGACAGTNVCAYVKNVFKPIFFEKTLLGNVREHGLKGSCKWIKETNNISLLAGAILVGLTCFVVIRLVKYLKPVNVDKNSNESPPADQQQVNTVQEK